mgnify:CR=1 FL=1
MSRIGKQPVGLPGGVEAKVSGQTIEVTGPKGTQSFTASDDVTLTVEDGAVIQHAGIVNSDLVARLGGTSRSRCLLDVLQPAFGRHDLSFIGFQGGFVSFHSVGAHLFRG